MLRLFPQHFRPSETLNSRCPYSRMWIRTLCWVKCRRIATPSWTFVLTDISSLFLLHECFKLQQHTVSHPSRSWPWYSPPWKRQIPQLFNYLNQYPHKLRSWYSILRHWICLSWWTIFLSFLGPESRLSYSQDPDNNNPY